MVTLRKLFAGKNKKKAIIITVTAVTLVALTIFGVLLHSASESIKNPTPSDTIVVDGLKKDSNGGVAAKVGFQEGIKMLATIAVKRWPLILMSVLVVGVFIAAALTVYYLTREQPEVPKVPEHVLPKHPTRAWWEMSSESLLVVLFLVIVVAFGGMYVFTSFKADHYPVLDYDKELQRVYFVDNIVSGLPGDRSGPHMMSEEQLEEKRKTSFVRQKNVHDQAFSNMSNPKESAEFILSTLGAVSTKPAIKSEFSSDTAKEGIKDRFVGAMVGLALGDAYGSPYEFKSPAQVYSMERGDDHVAVGYFSGRFGAWTDDTSMALCLLASAIETGEYVHEDVFGKYKRWFNSDDRYMNFDPTASDVGTTTREVLSQNKLKLSLPSWGNGVIMRLAPVVMQYIFSDTRTALRVAAASGASTSGDQSALDFTATLAYIMRGFIKGTLSKSQVCAKDFVKTHLGWYFDEMPYGVHFKKALHCWPKPTKSGGGSEEMSSHVVFSRALFTFCTTDTFTDGLNRVILFGGDTDTAAAVFGQIFGSYYGMSNVSGRHGFDAMIKVGGVAESKLYSSTQRADGIVFLSELLWSQITGDATQFNSIAEFMMKDGKVKDLNPKYHFESHVNDVYRITKKEPDGTEKNLSVTLHP